MKKKVVALICMIAMIFNVFNVDFHVKADNNEEFTYYYLSDGTIQIGEYHGNSKKVYIPSYVNGMMVSSISEEAFSTQVIDTVVVPKEVKTIWMEAGSYKNTSKLIVLGNDTQIKNYDNDITFDVSVICDYKSKAYTENNKNNLNVIPGDVDSFSGSDKTTSTIVGLKWTTKKNITGYEIYRYNEKSKKYERIAKVSGNTGSYSDKVNTASKKYSYKLRSYVTAEGTTFYSDFSRALDVYTLPKTTALNKINKNIKNGKVASVETKTIKAKADIDYTDMEGNYARVSPISDFIDSNGNYTVTYDGTDYIYILVCNSKLKVKKQLKIKKKYEEFGGVICDNQGNYYVAEGEADYKGTAKKATFAVSKYNSQGKLIKTCAVMPEDKYWATRYPFYGGNCAMTIQNGILVCSYGKKMYNGHQANGVVNIDIQTMKQVDKFYSYSSHSFDQRVLALNNGNVLFADLGDAFPRGFNLTESGEDNQASQHSNDGIVPFHFYGETGDNYTNALLGGIGELNTGYVLVGASAKSMTKAMKNQGQQLFMQVIDKTTGKSILKGTSRTGTSGGSKCTDTGIKWLTNYKKGATVGACNMVVIDSSRVLVIWEKNVKNGYEGTYYMILSASGKILQKATPMGNVRLNQGEEIKYHNGYIYWSTVEETLTTLKLTAHRMKIGKLEKRTLQDATLVGMGYSDAYYYTGKPVKPKFYISFGGKKLKKGKDYTVSYKNNIKAGKAKMTITGKGKYKGKVNVYYYIVR